MFMGLHLLVQFNWEKILLVVWAQPLLTIFGDILGCEEWEPIFVANIGFPGSQAKE